MTKLIDAFRNFANAHQTLALRLNAMKVRLTAVSDRLIAIKPPNAAARSEQVPFSLTALMRQIETCLYLWHRTVPLFGWITAEQFIYFCKAV